jgi:mannan endo-1,4-beta-mannosidase
MLKKLLGRYVLLASVVINIASCSDAVKITTPGFVKAEGGQFLRDGKPYRFMGANYWQGMNLGSPSAGGDRARMKRELDQMQSAGITNLRVLALSEGPDGSPYRILPAVQDSPAVLKEELLQGLDYLLDEMGKRQMTAVIVLNNFWQWSGGMGQYVRWNSPDSIPYPPPHSNGDWDRFQKYVARFYTIPAAVEQSHEGIRKLLNRVNSVNGRAYRDDPAIMAWQLCNEPRGIDQVEAFHRWIDSTSGLIKALDPNHLVSIGSEGYTSSPEHAGTDFRRMHSGKNIDYTTAHIWIQNWSWYDPQKHDSTYPAAEQKMVEYLQRHARESAELGKPFVLEEFGIMKDEGNFDPAATNVHRDQYYQSVFNNILRLVQEGQASGVNFWAWGGEGRPRVPGTMWQKGDQLTGDPPHEPQGWYSVYNTDSSTQRLVREYADRLSRFGEK